MTATLFTVLACYMAIEGAFVLLLPKLARRSIRLVLLPAQLRRPLAFIALIAGLLVVGGYAADKIAAESLLPAVVAMPLIVYGIVLLLLSSAKVEDLARRFEELKDGQIRTLGVFELVAAAAIWGAVALLS